MVDFDLLLTKRKKDNLPISVGTSLAIEALRENKRYDSIWINIRTLYRNILHSIEDKDERELFTNPSNRKEAAAAIARVISQETGIIKNFLNGRIDAVRLYCLGYTDLHRKFPNAKLKVPTTDIQKNYWGLMDAVIDEVLAEDYDQVIDWDKGSELEGEHTRSVIITNHAVDLLSRTKFKELRLLESHTGVIKSKSQWYTKLSDGKMLSNIPFNRFTIQVFGDGPFQFERWGHKFRNEIIGLASEMRWTPVTTLERIKFSLNRMRDKYSGELLKKLL
ncbi:hypothetical protein DQR70_05815 [Salmonella enterica subsp. enterica serovar Oslo]|nr:hypothetical protein [Salmonella enterica subsp. enterica serovar Oslo]